jgi:hypothetical protein
MELLHLLPVDNLRGPPSNPALLSSSGKPREGSLTQSNPLLLGYRRQYRKHRVLEDATRIEVLLSEAPPANTIASESLKVIQRIQHSFTAEAV